MSVWPVIEPTTAALATAEGPLVSVSIDVDARSLESLLDALAQLPFPINPEIYHDAAVVYRRAGGEETKVTTLVEFPAYSDRLADVRRALESYGFDPGSVQVTSMLDEIRQIPDAEHPVSTDTSISARRLKCRKAAI